MILFACDLDNTLIHSYKKFALGEVCVETKDGKELAYMSKYAYDTLSKISKAIEFTPLTTRSLSQYRRVRLFKDAYPKYALAANGGVLLIDNEIDKEWYKESLEIIKPAMVELEQALEVLAKDSNISFEIRLVDDLYVFTKSDNIEATVNNLKEKVSQRHIDILTIGCKVLVMPKVLNKGAAVKRFAKKYSAEYVIAAGDSEFDAPMLCVADLAFVPDKEFKDMFLPGKDNVIMPVPNKEPLIFGDVIMAKLEEKYLKA